jgi:hypothetical protein
MSPGGGRRRHYPQVARSPVGLRWGWGLAATSSNAPVLRCARSEHGREGVGLASSRAITPHAACPTVGAPTHISHGRSLRSQSGRVKLRRPGRRLERSNRRGFTVAFEIAPESSDPRGRCRVQGPGGLCPSSHNGSRTIKVTWSCHRGQRRELAA